MLAQATEGDAAFDAFLKLGARFLAKDALEESALGGPLLRGPGEVCIKAGQGMCQPEEFEVSPESFEGVVGPGRGLVSGHGCSLGGEVRGRASYSSRSRR